MRDSRSTRRPPRIKERVDMSQTTSQSPTQGSCPLSTGRDDQTVASASSTHRRACGGHFPMECLTCLRQQQQQRQPHLATLPSRQGSLQQRTSQRPHRHPLQGIQEHRRASMRISSSTMQPLPTTIRSTTTTQRFSCWSSKGSRRKQRSWLSNKSATSNDRRYDTSSSSSSCSSSSTDSERHPPPRMGIAFRRRGEQQQHQGLIDPTSVQVNFRPHQSAKSTDEQTQRQLPVQAHARIIDRHEQSERD